MMSDKLEVLQALAAMLPSEILKELADEHFKNSSEGFSAAAIKSQKKRIAKQLYNGRIKEIFESVHESEGSTRRSTTATILSSVQENPITDKPPSDESATIAKDFIAYPFDDVYCWMVLEKERKEKIDLAVEKLSMFSDRAPELDFAHASLVAFKDEYLGMTEAAEVLSLSRDRTKQLAMSNRLGVQVAGRYVFSLRELEEFKELDRPSGLHLSNRKKGRGG